MLNRSGSLKTLVLLLACSAFVSPAAAAPSTDDPSAALATLPEKTVEQLAADAEKDYQIASKAVAEMLSKLEANQVDKINPKLFTSSWVSILRMQRFSKRLQQSGEPAGVDFEVRASELLKQWQSVRNPYIKLKVYGDTVGPLYNKLHGEAAKRERTFKSVQAMVDQEKWENAASVIDEEMDELEIYGGWLPDDHHRPMIPFEEIQQVIYTKLDPIRVEEGKQRLRKQAESELPDFDALVTQAKNAAVALRAGKSPTLDGVQLTGPEFVGQAGSAWRKAHLATLHCVGFDFAQGMRLAGEDSGPLMELSQAYQNFAAEMGSALVDVINADAARTSEADAPALYAAYLKAAPPLLLQAADPKLTASFKQALASLAARSPKLQADAAAYEAATTNLLHWRKRLADAQQKNLAAEYPSFIPTALVSLRKEKGQPDSLGLVSADANSMSEVSLISPLPKCLERMKKELVGKQVTLPRSAGLNPAKKLAANVYHQRHYTTFTLPDGMEAEVGALKADLLVSDELPPLSLEAALAITAAERGDLQAMGVTVQRVFAEPFSTRLATLPAVAEALFPLGTLPVETMSQPSLSQLLLRSEVEPRWVRNEYFLLSVEP